LKSQISRLLSFCLVCLLLTSSIVTTDIAAAQNGIENRISLTVNWYEIKENGNNVLIGSKIFAGESGETVFIDPLTDTDGINYAEGRNNQNFIWSLYDVDPSGDDGQVTFGETNEVNFYLMHYLHSSDTFSLAGNHDSSSEQFSSRENLMSLASFALTDENESIPSD